MYNMKTSGTVDNQIEDTPDIGKGRYFSISPYTELAHFLVVRKILSRFRKVYYVMDGSKTLYSAALTALTPDIREERAEIVLFSTIKNPPIMLLAYPSPANWTVLNICYGDRTKPVKYH